MSSRPSYHLLPLRILVGAAAAAVAVAQHSDYQPHYLVGALNLPNANIPDIFKNITSGTYLGRGEYDNWVAHPDVPFRDVPLVGFSDIEPYYDGDEPARGQFFCLSDNGYGSSANSADYPLNIARVKIERPFAYGHGGSAFDGYTEAELLGAAFIHDPRNLIRWENGAHIRVTYKVPDATWDDLVEKRVLTGRDVDPEGLAVFDNDCAVVGDELMTAVFKVNPTTGEVLSPFVRTPDIDSETGAFVDGKFLSTVSDKVHCDVAELEADADSCLEVKSEDVVAAGYREQHKSWGYEGFSALPDGSIAAFLEKVMEGEPGVRVYNVDPGCASGGDPQFKSFRGYYPFEKNANSIADVSAIPGTSDYVLVIERNGYPGLLSGEPKSGEGHKFPSPALPANKVCLVDLTDLDDDLVMHNKKCILNYHIVSDPWDVDGDGKTRFGFTQVTTEQLVVVDDYCIVAGTDTNYPWTNQLGLDLDALPYGEEVQDSRWMVICFEEPIFDLDILGEYMNGDGTAAGTLSTENGEGGTATAKTSAANESSLLASSCGTLIGLLVFGLWSFAFF